MEILGRRAKSASREGAKLGTDAKNRGLITVAEELIRQKAYLLEENTKDVEAAKEKGVKESLIDRLQLTESRIEAMAEGFGHENTTKRTSNWKEKSASWSCRNYL